MKLLRLIIAGMTLALLMTLAACSDPETTRRVLGDQGLTNIETHGYSLWGCGQADVWVTKFSATTVTGNHVEGVVCRGFFKGSTIRFF